MKNVVLELDSGIYSGWKLMYATGKFDDWCVFLVDCAGKEHPPLDKEYFYFMSKLGKEYGRKKVFNDFKKVYDITQKSVSQEAFNLCKELSLKYNGIDRDAWFAILAILHMAMVAEENKENSILGKRVKMMGVYSVLVEGKSPEYAADFMRGVDWRTLDRMFTERGF